MVMQAMHEYGHLGRYQLMFKNIETLRMTIIQLVVPST